MQTPTESYSSTLQILQLQRFLDWHVGLFSCGFTEALVPPTPFGFVFINHLWKLMETSHCFGAYVVGDMVISEYDIQKTCFSVEQFWLLVAIFSSFVFSKLAQMAPGKHILIACGGLPSEPDIPGVEYATLDSS